MESLCIRVLVVSVSFKPCQFAHRATHEIPSISLCYNASLEKRQTMPQSDKGSVDARLLSAKKEHFWTFPQSPPSGKV